MAKILAKKCSGRLYEVTEKLHIPVFEEEKLEEIAGSCFLLRGLRNLCEGLGSARKRRSRGFQSELHSSNEGGRMFEPEGRVCAGA